MWRELPPVLVTTSFLLPLSMLLRSLYLHFCLQASIILDYEENWQLTTENEHTNLITCHSSLRLHRSKRPNHIHSFKKEQGLNFWKERRQHRISEGWAKGGSMKHARLAMICWRILPRNSQLHLHQMSDPQSLPPEERPFLCKRVKVYQGNMWQHPHISFYKRTAFQRHFYVWSNLCFLWTIRSKYTKKYVWVRRFSSLTM